MGKMPAFQFYPGDWKGSKWITFEPDDWHIAPIPGCYVIYGDDEILYIGQAMDVKKRIKSHGIYSRYTESFFTPWGQYGRVKIKIHYGVKYGDWAMRELRLIRRLQPKCNCVYSIKKRKNV